MIGTIETRPRSAGRAGGVLSPLVDAVVKGVMQRIDGEELRPGDRLPTIRVLAAQFDVSYATAQLAVGHLESLGLVERVQGSGTYVRRSLSRDDMATREAAAERGQWVSLFLGTREHVEGRFNSEMFSVMHRNDVFGLSVPWGGLSTDLRFSHVLDLWQWQPPAGVVLNMHDRMRDQLVFSSAPRSARVVCVFRMPETVYGGWHTVNPDYTDAYRMAAAALIERGHTRIGIVSKKRIIASNWRHTARKAWMLEGRQILGAGQALREADLRHGLSIHYNDAVKADPSGIPVDDVNLRRMARWLSGPDRPTALIGEDYRLYGAAEAAKSIGLRVGEDLELLPIGGRWLSDEQRDTYIDFDWRLMAEQTVSLIRATDKDLGGAARHVLVPAQMVRLDQPETIFSSRP